MNDLEIMMSYCNKCKHKGTCITPCPSVWFAVLQREKERTGNKPIRIDGFTEKCPKCGEKVMYAVGTGTMFHGASESYEDWRVIKHDFCPRCGIKIEREGADNE